MKITQLLLSISFFRSSALLQPAIRFQFQPKRTVIKFSRKKGKKKSVKAVTARFYRFNRWDGFLICCFNFWNIFRFAQANHWKYGSIYLSLLKAYSLIHIEGAPKNFKIWIFCIYMLLSSQKCISPKEFSSNYSLMKFEPF